MDNDETYWEIYTYMEIYLWIYVENNVHLKCDHLGYI